MPTQGHLQGRVLSGHARRKAWPSVMSFVLVMCLYGPDIAVFR